MRGTLTPEIEATFEACAETDAMRVDCDPQVVESAVFEVVRGTPLEREYHAEREACYGVDDPEARDRAFAKLHNDWFARLRLAAPVLEAIAEFPDVAARAARCVIAPAVRRSDEGAELYGHGGSTTAQRPNLVIRLRPGSFRAPAHIASLMRHELMHIEDMLEPTFGYDPSTSQFLDDDGVPTVIRDRYRVLWDMYIDGRLHRAGRVNGNVRATRLSEFARAFKPFGEQAEAVFDTVFTAPALTHHDLIAFARRPAAIVEHFAAR